MRKTSCLLMSITGACITNVALASSDLLELNRQGNQAVIDLKRWYDSTADDCGGPDKPGYLCSGITMRTTSSSPGFLPWEPSDSQIEKGSVAFSWLRRDNNFGKPFGNQNGLIMYPTQAVPEGKIADLKVLCSFPINANTNQRPTLQGCGPIAGYEETTDTCQALDINTAQQWLAKYPQASNYRVCGWELRKEQQDNAAKWFQTALDAREGMPDAHWHINNEVLLPVWEKGKGGELPLHSFFYVKGEREALAKAQYDQIRYQQKYDQLIPVVQVTFPTEKEGTLNFAYDAQDQAAGQPTPTPSVDFESLPVGQHARVTSNAVEFQLDRINRGVGDKPHEASKGLISAKHLEVDSTIKFVLEGAGRRLVTFSWGCNSYCGLQTVIGGGSEELSEDGPGEMRYGSKELIIDGPEAIILAVDTEEDGSLLVLDNLKVQKLPEK
ncbi:hypothetical protein [Pseudomonas sp. GZD-222]|uniref:hypothetical protein n=1 Tax=Pseudomonas sp. GZD-222 TaxID=3404805 RepID=UPI003BB4BC6A